MAWCKSLRFRLGFLISCLFCILCLSQFLMIRIFILNALPETAGREAIVGRLISIGALSIALGFIVSILSLFVLERRMVRPLLCIARRVEKITSGDFTENIEVFSWGELGVLSRGMNRMISAFRRSIETQRLEALGQMAAGISHDFTNIQTAISGFAYLARHEVQPGSKALKFLDNIVQASEKGSALIKQLLEYSKNRTSTMNTMRLDTLVDETCAMIAPLLGGNVAVKVHHNEKDLKVYGDQAGLSQVLTNLILNARDAMPDGGSIEIFTALTQILPGSYSEYDSDQRKWYVMLSVVDDGEGMEVGVLGKIFEPFFSTKGSDKGTGLGLATVKRIVHQHGGWIKVFSEPGQGSSFTVFLPLIEAGRYEYSTQEDGRESPVNTSGGNILVVEDEKCVCDVIELTLLREGYAVTTLSNAEDALELLESTKGGYDALFTDAVLPGMSGTDLARRARRDFPEMAVLIGSGYRLTESPAKEFEELGIEFISKPYRPSKIIEMFEKVGKRSGAPGDHFNPV